MAVELVPEIGMTPHLQYPAQGYMADTLQPTVDYSAGYLDMPYYTTQPTPGPYPGTEAEYDSGPFLSVQQPMSPDPNAITPRQSHFAQNTSPNLDYESSSSGAGSGAGTGAGDGPSSSTGLAHSQPLTSRYVSASAFPDTPLSVDPSGLGGLDRRISYANAGGLDWHSAHDSVPDHDHDREDEDEDEGDEVSRVIKMELPSPSKPDMPLSPSSAPSHPGSAEGAGGSSFSAASSPVKSPAPRPGRRARSVASAFN